MKKELKIISLPNEREDEFFLYLQDHVSDNGLGDTLLFMPISRKEGKLPKEKLDSVRKGFSIPIGEWGWRRVLMAENEDGKIVGHIDLFSYNQPYTNHRAYLGMGVHRDYRRMGLGESLMEAIFEWAKAETSIEWIELWVLAHNLPAIRLYERVGFKKVGEIEDRYRIDGEKIGQVLMAKRLG